MNLGPALAFASLRWWTAALWCWAPGKTLDPNDAAVPSGAGAEDIGWLVQAPWAKIALVVTVAVIVLSVGNMLMKRKPGRSKRRPDFDLEVARLENLPVTTIAEAAAGPVHLEGVIVSSVGMLGGAKGRECIYRNRVGAGRRGAVGSELIVVRDETGQAGVENLEDARVIAPREEGPNARASETFALYVGDHVQVLGDFSPQRYGEDEDPKDRVYGMLGAHAQVQVRVLHRPDPESADPDSSTPPRDSTS